MNLNVGQSKMLKMRYRKKQQCLRKVSKQKQAGHSQKISICNWGLSGRGKEGE